MGAAMIGGFLGRYLGEWRTLEAWMWADAYNEATGAFGPAGSGLTAIAFPRDGGVVLGLSVDERPDELGARDAASRFLEHLMETSGAVEGFAEAEELPPLSIEEWRDAMARATVAPQRNTATGPTISSPN